MRRFLRRKIMNFLQEEDGPTSVEYAVMLAMIIITCIGAVMTLGGASGALFTSSDAQIRSAMN